MFVINRAIIITEKVG
jgi:hypothetical protein